MLILAPSSCFQIEQELNYIVRSEAVLSEAGVLEVQSKGKGRWFLLSGSGNIPLGVFRSMGGGLEARRFPDSNLRYLVY